MSFLRSLPKLIAHACLMAVAILNIDAATNWRNVAINGGGFVSGIVFNPGQQNLIYARTDVGGAYRWDQADSHWIALNDDIGGLNNEFMHLGVLSIAVDPNDVSRLYLACGQYTTNASWNPTGIILRSTDQGATWIRSTLSVRLGGNEDGRNTGERLGVDPNYGQVLFLGTSQDGLWKSSDYGATWANVPTFPAASCTLVLFDKTTGLSNAATRTIYVGVNSTTGTSLYQSVDGGATWSAVAGQPTGLIPQHADIGYASDGRTLYIAYSNALGPNGATGGAVWKMDLGTGAWTNITPSAGSWGFGGVSVAASDPHTLVASTIDRWSLHDEIYRSNDMGATWTGILQSGSLDTSSAPWAAASTPHWTADVKIDPFNSAHTLFVTGYGLFASNNAASPAPVWAFQDSGLEETVPAMFVSPPSGPPLVSVVGDVDGFSHNSVAIAPSSRHVPMEGSNSSIDFAETNASVMARTFYTAAGGAWSADSGLTWTLFGSVPPALGTSGGTIAVSADGSRFVWSSSAMAPYYSADHGATWTLSSGVAAGSAPIADRVNPAKFYVYNGTTGLVSVSTDGGVTFTAGASVPSGASPMRAVPGIEGNLWLPARGSGLLHSIDSGKTFQAVASVQEAYGVGFGKAAASQTYPAIFIWGKIANVVGLFRSDDAGATWTRINDDLHQFGYINWLSGDPRTYGRVYLATSGRGIVYGDLLAAPTVVTQPASQTIITGQNAMFTVTASGSPSPTYQWQLSGDNGATWSNLTDGGIYSGTTTASMTVSGATLAMSGDQFLCQISNGVSPNAASAAATLTVEVPLPAPAAAAGSAVIAGGFSASWAPVSGANGYRLDVSTSSSFGFATFVTGYQDLDLGNVTSASITGLASNATYYYRVRAYDSGGEGISSRSIAVTTTPAIVISTPLTVSTLAGLAGSSGSADSAGNLARFFHPLGIATDNAGDLYVADTDNDTIRKIVAGTGAVTTLAGLAGSSGSADGTGSGARFFNPSDVAVDTAGNIYVADTLNCTLRKVTPAGVVSTLAGVAGRSGSADGAGSNARFQGPEGLAIDSAGNLFVADTNNHTIRMVVPSTGVVATLAGLAGNSGSADGTGSLARFTFPSGVAVDRSGRIFVSDTANHTIRAITPAGLVSTLAGTAGSSGGADGAGSAATFDSPSAIAVDLSGNVYVADTDNATIRMVAPSTGATTTLAGLAGSSGAADGVGSAVRFDAPSGIALDANGNLYISDTGNQTVRLGMQPLAPSIQSQPQSQTATAGASVQFSVSASGRPTLAYQWDFNGVAINGATGATYGLTNVQAASAGSYTVRVTNGFSSVTSSPATLAVNAATPPPSAGGGGGGGGAPSLWFYGTLLLLIAGRRAFCAKHKS